MKTIVSVQGQLCYCCGKKTKVGATVYRVDTRDYQTVDVGPECYRKIKSAGDRGFKHHTSPLALYPLSTT